MMLASTNATLTSSNLNGRIIASTFFMLLDQLNPEWLGTHPGVSSLLQNTAVSLLLKVNPD
jgi:hypothetical protein